MNEEIIRITKELVKFKTTPENKKEIDKCFKFIEKEMEFYPFIVKKYEKNGVRSIVWLTEDTLRPDIVLNAHIDVVPGDEKMFEMKEVDGKLLGRGVSDMKFSIGIFIAILKQLIISEEKLPSIGMMITSDEENGGFDGVGYLVEEIGYEPGVAVVPDGGDNLYVVEKSKGVLQLEIRTKGKSAHASRPWEGESAIDNLIQDINNLRELYPVQNENIWKTTLNIGKINGGVQTNQVSDGASLQVDIRYVPEEDPDEIEEKIAEVCNRSIVRRLELGSPFYVDRRNLYITKWAKLLDEIDSEQTRFMNEEGASDGRYFSANGIPTIVSKPIGGLIHTEDEWIDKNSVVDYAEVLRKFILLMKD